MSGFEGVLDRTFFSIGATRVTLGGLLLLALIAGTTFIVSWALRRLIDRGARLVGVTREGPVAVARRLTHYLVVALGLAVGLDTLGINLGALFAAGAIFAIGIGGDAHASRRTLGVDARLASSTSRPPSVA